MTVQEYQRVGLVRAKQLTHSRTWSLDKGTHMTSQPGDWWVWSGDDEAEGRGVAPEEFEATHRRSNLTGIYFRTAQVRARRLAERTAAETLEGEDMGEPGEWLVTDGFGNSWCVPDDDFRDGYEPVD